MEMTNVEMALIEEAVQQQAVSEILELCELQLALVGGGIADIVVG
jgi:hypothetical protein